MSSCLLPQSHVTTLLQCSYRTHGDEAGGEAASFTQPASDASHSDVASVTEGHDVGKDGKSYIVLFIVLFVFTAIFIAAAIAPT